jgi:hypothetical protein
MATGFPEVADALERQHGLVRELQPVAPLTGDVLVRQDGVHAGEPDRSRNVDRRDASVRVRAAERRAPEHARGVEVTCVRELPRNLRDGVPADDRLPDAADLEALGRGRHRPAAILTASKIFW